MTETEPLETEPVRIERDGAVVTVVIDRPKSLNALSPEVLAGLTDAFESLADEGAAIAGVLLVGEGGRAFVAGADIRTMSTYTAEQGAEIGLLGHRLAQTIERFGAPVIACVDGHALGGGLELAMACDFIYATDASHFGQPEVKLGLIPGFGGTVRLPRFVGPARAKELIYTGASIDVVEAERIGLVARRYPDRDELLAAAADTIRTIGANAWPAVAIAKQVFAEAAGTSTEVAARVELDGFEAAFRTGDMREGVAAFLEKRTPKFTGE